MKISYLLVNLNSAFLCERKEHWWMRPGLLAILLWSIPSTERNQILHRLALYSAIVQKWNSVCFLNLENSQFLPTLSDIHTALPMSVDRGLGCVCVLGGTVRIKQFNEIFTPMVLTYILESLWVLFNFIHSANHPRLTLTPTPAPWSGRERAMQRLARHQESESRIERK